MTLQPPYLLFDDARPGGGGARLYQHPKEIVRADRMADILPALARLEAALDANFQVAGYLAYEAGYALDPALTDHFRDSDGPLLWFGIFDEYVTLDAAMILPDAAGGWHGLPGPRIAPEAYEQAAGEVREHLYAGNYYQANLTFGCDVQVAGGPLHHYAALRGRQQAGWGGVIDIGEDWLVSLSPEQFFRVQNGLMEAKPMKGTAQRHPDPEADQAEAEALARDPKQRAENLMIVDLMRNDLARLAVPGSVEVPDLFAVESYPTVHQLVSRITARLAPTSSAVDLLRHAFPCGSVTGAPKIAAMQSLRRLEPEARGAYTGSMGWIEPRRPDGSAGDAAFNVMIRTLQGRHDEPIARLGLGSGLVVDSQPRDEWAECLLKGRFMEMKARIFDLIETMRFDPEIGVCRLEDHLARMKASAEELEFSFDRHEARNELQAATFGQKNVSRVRLLLGRSGAMAIEVLPMSEDDLPEPVDIRFLPLPVAPDDFRLSHKTTDRDFYDEAREQAGTSEVIFHLSDDRIVDGSRTSIFLKRGDTYLTPPLYLARMPGILRKAMIESGEAREEVLTCDDLRNGDLYVGNSLRGLLAARIVD